MDGASSPRKCASSAAYAVPAAKWEASTDGTIGRLPISMPGIVTSLHVVPWLRDTWMMPVLVAIQMTPGATVDVAIDTMLANDDPDVSLGDGWARVSEIGTQLRPGRTTICGRH